MVEREGSHSRRAQKSSLGAGFLSDSCQDKENRCYVGFLFVGTLGICRVGLGVLLLWRLRPLTFRDGIWVCLRQPLTHVPVTCRLEGVAWGFWTPCRVLV